MKIKSDKTVVLITIVISVLFFITSCYKASEVLASSDKYRLVWNDDPTTTVTIAWNQIDGENPVVLYDKNDFGRKDWKYKYKQSPTRIQEKYGMNTHFAKLSNLEADENYYFVIKDSKGICERYWFKTAPAMPKPFTFIAGGDTKSSGAPLEAGQASNRLVAKLRPLFVLFSGDFNSGNGTKAKYWQQWLDDWQAQTTTPDGRMIPIIPVHGNHENGDHANLSYIFNTPFQSNNSSNIYYSLSLGGNFMHIIALNSEIEEGGLQRKWLENDLETHEDFTFKIAAYHKPFWPHTSTKREQEYQYNQWAVLFYKYGLSLSFDADSHMSKITYPLRPDSTENSFLGFIRDDKNGTMFLGEGSWGAHPRPNDDDKPWTYKSGSFNGFKLAHVFPEQNGKHAHINIYPVISVEYYENKDIILYDSVVESLTEENVCNIPKNLKIQELPDGKDHVT
ncbi:MAG: metallophosphoesterase family protein, partial [Bacteroidales bacterium]|nr:metallophosphoesterase family protein [Bacteroidales bacterium]